MANVGNIYIIGAIGNDGFSEVSLRSVMEQVKNLGDVDSYLVNINSAGGEVTEGYAIYNYLTSLNKPITTRGVGLVASIATVIFLSGDTRELYANTQFLIHNPWTFGEGDAEALQKKAEELKSIENQLLEFYVKKTGGDKIALQDLMKEDKLIPSNIAQELKFATTILDNVKAFAFIKKENNNTMSKIGKIFKDAFKALQQHGVILNETVMTNDGKELEITMSGESISIGDSVSINGEPADGVYTLADGTMITVSNGTITEMEKAQAEAQASTEINNATKAVLEQRIAELEQQLQNVLAENETLKAEQTEMIEEVAVITNHLKHLKVNIAVPTPQASFNGSTKNATVEMSKDEVKNRIAELKANSKKRTVVAI